MAESIDMDEQEEQEARARGDFLEDEDVENDDDRVDGEEGNGGQDEDISESEEESEGGEDGEDGEEDEGDEEEADEEGEEPAEEHRIPKSRLDEVIQQREHERERAEWLQERLESLLSKEENKAAQVEDKFDYEAKEVAYTEAIITGEADTASKLRREIDDHRQDATRALIEEARQEALKSATDESRTQIEEEKFTSLVEVYEEKYPFLKNGGNDYNEEAVEVVNALMTGYMSNMGKVASLKKAISQGVKMFGKPEKVVGKIRKSAAVKRNIQAAKQQPSKKSRGKRDNTDDDVNVARISDKKFRALSQRERSELRGDFL